MPPLRHLLVVALGGAVGAAARYGIGGWVHSWSGSAFPWGTFAVNVVGSVLIGFALGYLDAVLAPAELRAFVAVGLLGAFTTFSTYAWETVVLLRTGAWPRAALYALGSLALGVLAVLLGLGLATWLVRARG